MSSQDLVNGASETALETAEISDSHTAEPNDEKKTFSEIHESSASLRQMVLAMTDHSFLRSRSQSWLDTMRILEIQDSAVPHSDARLKLTSRTTLADPSAFVAVSYCWNREQVGWFDVSTQEPIQVEPGNGCLRPSSAPPDVLHRAVAYARSHEVDAIWIDQECIDQSDPADKEDGIQAMDIVYQESLHPVAILETCFESQDELDIFASVVDNSYLEFDPDKIDALGTILEALADDQWFTRAWTLQESVSAGVSMLLLIGCPGLEKPKAEMFGNIHEELEISIWHLQEAMVNVRNLIEEGLAQDIWADAGNAIHASNCADELWNRLPTMLPSVWGAGETPDLQRGSDARQDTSYRQQCNAAQAVAFLAERQNSYFPDRLAILANMCNYETRLNLQVLEAPDSSFSTAALTLSILNGDMSLLSGYDNRENSIIGLFNESVEDHRVTGNKFQGSDSGMQSVSYGFSWGPEPDARLRDVTYLEENGAMYRLQPATLSVYGLTVKGVLWQMAREIKVPKTQAKFEARWKQELATQDEEGTHDEHERQRLLMYEFSMSLLEELVEGCFITLAKTFWQFLRPYGWHILASTKMVQTRSFTFEEVFDAKAVSNGKLQVRADLAHDLKMQWSTSLLSIDPKLKGFDRPSINRQLIEQVTRKGTLVCGVPVIAAESLSLEPYVWFVGIDRDDLVFTPLTEIGDEAAMSAYNFEAVSWTVHRMNQIADDCDILQCEGRKQGFWRLEGLQSINYILD